MLHKLNVLFSVMQVATIGLAVAFLRSEKTPRELEERAAMRSSSWPTDPRDEEEEIFDRSAGRECPVYVPSRTEREES